MVGRTAILAILLMVVSAWARGDARAPEGLAAGFTAPPDSAKPYVFWFWMNGNITKEGITKDLEAMKKVGLGGVIISNVSCDMAPGPVIFNSPEWLALMEHAIKEADRLGLKISDFTGAGWEQSGGPWVTAENSMQKLTWSETNVAGPAHFKSLLPQPGITHINPATGEPLAVKPYYRDVAVLAYRSPEANTRPMPASQPKITTNTGSDGAALADGNGETGVTLTQNGNQPAWVQIEFPQPFTAQALDLQMLGRSATKNPKGILQVSLDGKNFTKVTNIVIPGNGPLPSMAAVSFPPTTGRFFRVQLNHLDGDEIGMAEVKLSATERIPDWPTKAGFIRGEWRGTESPGAVEKAVPLKDIIDLTNKMSADGALNWEVPTGSWTILRLGQTSTGAICHPAAVGGAGLDVDKLSKEALETFWNGHMAKILAGAGSRAGQTFTTVHVDSWEVGAQNWTKKFPEEFRARRGYDPMPYLPAMVGVPVQSAAVTDRFLWDVRRTISDLFADNYYGHLRTLAQQHGMTLSTEPYGLTGNFEDFQVGSRGDLPMGTFFAHFEPQVDQEDRRASKFAASIAHTEGKKYVGAEAFTARPTKGQGSQGTARWLDTPYTLKAVGDTNGFCSGVNRFVISRYALQPWSNVQPGMTFGRVGIHFERTLTWWDQAHAWMAYLSRCQWMLQQGLFSADICSFTGENPVTNEDALAFSGIHQAPHGYDWDVCNAEVIRDRMSVKDGRIVLPDGMSYRYLELPNQKAMTPGILRKIKDLVAAGATVVGPRPTVSPSLSGYPDCDAEVSKLGTEVWGACNGMSVKENHYGQGRVIWGKTWQEIFAEDKLPPDFSYAAKNKDARIFAIHRHDGAKDIYFLANASDRVEETVCTFRVNGKVPALWHPDTGKIEQAVVWQEKDGRTAVLVPFDPRGSVFVVFEPGQADSVTQLTENGQNIFPNLAAEFTGLMNWTTSGAVLTAFQPGNYAVEFSSGKKAEAAVPAVPAVAVIGGPWNVTFAPNLGAPASAVFEKLISWPESADPGIKYFSGAATYTKEIEVPADLLSNDHALVLDLGQVDVIAELSVNGKDFGVLWKPPFQADITSALKSGKNLLTIKVVDLWPNRLIGDDQLPADYDTKGNTPAKWPDWVINGTPRPTKRVTFAAWRLWKKSDPLLESGLLGPVRLLVGVKKLLGS